jgi:CxxC motif-containing protein (DUF1111 family)
MQTTPAHLFALAGLLAGCADGSAVTPIALARAATSTTLGDPLPGLAAALQQRFAAGADAFAEEEGVADGLGPVFNGTACGECHGTPVLGGSGAQVETRFGRLVGGAFDPLSSAGGSLIQSSGIGTIGACTQGGETVPAAATVTAGRRTTPLFGLGLVDAVPAATLTALAASEPAATRGRVNLVADPTTGRQEVGRFGWKSQVASLLTFAADAYLNEMGITSPTFPAESCPQGDCARLATCDTVADPEDDGTDVRAFRDFMMLLAPPVAPTLTGAARAGKAHFIQIGCADCHLETLHSGPSPVTALANVDFHPWSDFLVHDMGRLGDGIAQGTASGTEMRTAPLWGLTRQPRFLHDGRATTVEQAITAHDGQAAAARSRFTALAAPLRSQLLAFLDAL